jgi:hypothetical protein
MRAHEPGCDQNNHRANQSMGTPLHDQEKQRKNKNERGCFSLMGK